MLRAEVFESLVEAAADLRRVAELDLHRHDFAPILDDQIDLGAAVGDEFDERRHAERVRQQDELLTRVVAALPGCGEELDAGEPFVALETDLARVLTS